MIDLGLQPLANNLLSPEDLDKPEPRFPLTLSICQSCWLLQIEELVSPVELFSEYLYFSSVSDALLEHSKTHVDERIQTESLGPDSFVIEIASNDGYLLKNYKKHGIPCLGIEPAANIAKVATEQHQIETVVDFFGLPLARTLRSQGRRADVIHANNVFAHVPDPNDFIAGIATLLKSEGTAVLEFPYGLEMIEHNEFDTIYHEHVFYFTVTALMPLVARHELAIHKVERFPIHGGTLRLFVSHEGSRPIHSSVESILELERTHKLDTLAYYSKFAKNVAKIRTDLLSLIESLKANGKSIAAYGASAKGSTLLNYFGLPEKAIDFIVDRSPVKQGKLSPGTHLPILPPEALLEKKPDYALLLTWNFKEEILSQQREFRERGGKFIIPIPNLSVV